MEKKLLASGQQLSDYLVDAAVAAVAAVAAAAVIEVLDLACRQSGDTVQQAPSFFPARISAINGCRFANGCSISFGVFNFAAP